MLTIAEYSRIALATQRNPHDDVGPRRAFLLLGLYGEVGSLLAEWKKHEREGRAYSAFMAALLEEFGDVLWYLNALSDLDGQPLSTLVARQFPQAVRFGDLALRVAAPSAPPSEVLLALAGLVVELLARPPNAYDDLALAGLLHALVVAAAAAGVDLDSAARGNLEKILGRWPTNRDRTPLFDDRYANHEQLPRNLVVEFRELGSDTKRFVLLRSGGLHIGDRLTDNIKPDDDYRFHDVFHLAYAAVLGWSPVLRSLLRCKRKSNPEADEKQDGARALIIEEGVSTWVFNHAKERRYFKDGVDYNLLKAVRKLVTGFEVDQCKPWEWEEAILQGFDAFRFLQEARGARVTMDLAERRLSFQEL